MNPSEAGAGRGITWCVIAMIVVFVALAAGSSLLFPVFEAPDEQSHLLYARLIARGYLPIQTDPELSAHAEGYGPPLYYMLLAPVLRVMDPNLGEDFDIRTTLRSANALATGRARRTGDMSPDTSLVPPHNPLFFWWRLGGDPNWYTHPPDGPLAKGPLLAVHAMRLVSVGCGVLTLVGVFLFARTCLPGHPLAQLVAVAVVAFNPQFIYLSGVLNSDNLVTVMATFALWQMAETLTRGSISDRQVVVIGAILGLGALSKTSAFFLMVPAVAVLFVVRRSVGAFAKQVAILSAVVSLLAGWFYLRNGLLYGGGDFFGWKTQARLEPIFTLPEGYRLEYFKSQFFQDLYRSYWGFFGWMSIPMRTWQYVFFGVISAMGLVSLKGLAATDGGWPARSLALLCYGVFGLNVVSLIAFNFRIAANQGRLLFPSIAVVAVSIALGWNILTRRLGTMGRRVACGMLVLALISLVVYVQWIIVYPVYF